MKENKENKESGGGKKELTPQELQKRKKMIIFPLLFLLFAGSMWLIFAPSSSDKEKAEQQSGLNTDLPMPKEEGIVEDKRDAYEQEALKQKDEEKKRSLQDFAFLLEEDEQSQAEEYESSENFSGFSGGNPHRSTGGIQSSAAAYQDVNKQLGAWYDQPATEEDEQSKLALEFRIQELERKLDEETQRKKIEDDQLDMMEKSYQLAAKYMPGGNTQVEATTTEEKVAAQPVRQVRHNVVSRLSAPMGNDEFLEQFNQPRNMGFLTVAGNECVTDKNTISACVHQTVTLTNGKEVPIRLLEPMQAGNLRIPANTIVSGACRIGGERLNVTITSIQYAGNIITVELQVYDTDGQIGIFVPGNEEINAAKEVAATLASSSGSSIMLSDNAGSQLAADLGRGLIQGASQYVSKKMSTVKVTLKAGHRVLLLPKNQ